MINRRFSKKYNLTKQLHRRASVLEKQVEILYKQLDIQNKKNNNEAKSEVSSQVLHNPEAQNSSLYRNEEISINKRFHQAIQSASLHDVG